MWGNHKESPEQMVEMVWACDEKRGALYVGRRTMEMEVQGRRKSPDIAHLLAHNFTHTSLDSQF